MSPSPDASDEFPGTDSANPKFVGPIDSTPPLTDDPIVASVDQLLSQMLRPERNDETTDTKTSTDDLWIAEHLPDRFSVKVPLGSGTFGVVFSALDRRLNRDVAIKILRPEWMNNPGARKRFLRESQTAARLNHPHILRVLESDENRLITWQVCDLVTGSSLAEHLKFGPLPIEFAAQFAWQLANALEYAHTKGILHRDLKPDNILVDRRTSEDLHGATVFLSDFGLAKILDEDSHLSRSGMVAGTPKYMAPEYIESAGATITPLADVYSLGMVLCECLTGRCLSDGADHLLQMASRAQNNLQRLRRDVKNLPRDLETICRRATAPIPSDRYRSAAALANDLASFLSGQPIQARRRGFIEELAGFAQRHQAMVGLTAVAVVSLVVALVVFINSSRQLFFQNQTLETISSQMTIAKDDAVRLAIEAEEQRNAAWDAKNRFQTLAWNASIKEAYNRWADRNVWGAREKLQQVLDIRTDASRRVEWSLLQSDLAAQFDYLLDSDTSIQEVRAIPDQEQVVALGQNGQVWWCDLRTGIIEVGPRVAEVSQSALAIDPTGNRLAVGGNAEGKLDRAIPRIFDRQTKETTTLSGLPTTIESMIFSPDGESLLVGARYENPQLHHLPSGLVTPLPGERRNVWLDYLPTTKQFVFQVKKDELGFCHPNEPHEVRRWDTTELFGSHEILTAVASPLGNHLAVGLSGQQGIWLLDCQERGIILAIDETVDSRVRCLAHHPTQPIVAAGFENGRTKIWEYSRGNNDVEPTTSISNSTTNQGYTRRLLADAQIVEGPILSLCFTGEKLIAGSESGQVVSQVIPTYLPAEQPLAVGTIHSPHFVSDGSDLVCMSNDTHVYQVPVTTLVSERLAASWSDGAGTGAFATSSVQAYFDEQRRVPRTLGTQLDVLGYAVNQDGSKLAWLLTASSIALLDNGQTQTLPRPVAEEGYPLHVQLMGFVDDDKTLVVEGEHYALQFISVDRPSLPPTQHFLDGETLCMTENQDHSAVYVGGRYEGIIRIDLGTNNVQEVTRYSSETNYMQLTRDDQTLITGHADGTIRVFKSATGNTQALVAHTAPVECLVLTSDEKIGISIDSNQQLAVWDVSEAELLGKLGPNFPTDSKLRTGTAISFSPDDQYLHVVSNSPQGPILRSWKVVP
ncbi:MAG: WD40 repeat domain-containing serine/threonine-protein kinase [Pirellulaceae bacterium]|nr:WD40 repeat domain-containing serine/threonine-protein kinase [Pirellulaceae bacterium]